MHLTTMEEELPPDRCEKAEPVAVSLYPRHVKMADEGARKARVSRSEFIQRLIEESNQAALARD